MDIVKSTKLLDLEMILRQIKNKNTWSAKYAKTTDMTKDRNQNKIVWLTSSSRIQIYGESIFKRLIGAGSVTVFILVRTSILLLDITLFNSFSFHFDLALKFILY